jgi:ELWxxDGT repeat protein
MGVPTKEKMMLQNSLRSLLRQNHDRRTLVCAPLAITLLGIALGLIQPLAATTPVPIKDIYTQTDGGSISLGVEKDGYLYYGACYEEDFFGCELVRTPVGGTGVERVRDINPGNSGSNPHTFVNANGTVFFVANSNQLWKTDGTEAGTQQVQGFVQIRTGDGERPVVLGDEVIFKAESWSGFGRELWVTDGTTTTQFQICSGACDGDPYDLTVAAGRVFFRAWDGSDAELYKYEPGTSGPGTVSQIGDIHPSGSSSPRDIAPLGGGVIFQANSDTEVGLYTSDGFGNTKVAGSSVFFYGLTEMVSTGSHAFFDAFDGNFISGREIWISNGLSAGTGIIADINPGTGSSDPQDLTVVGNSVFFSANDGNGRDLFISPAGAGAFPLEVVPGPGGPGDLRGFTNLDAGNLFFIADNGSGTGSEPWISDGTIAGTHLLGDLDPGTDSGINDPIFATSGLAFFPSDALDGGDELWRYGIASGFAKLTDLSTKTSGGAPNGFTSFGGFAYFCADDGINDKELWRTDGTTAGTFILDNVNASGFGCGLGNEGIVVAGGAIYYPGNNGTSWGLYKSNGAPGGSVLVKTFVDAPQQLTEHGGALYFTADDGTGAGRELWRSDGTTVGTVLVKDLYPGSLPANVEDLTSAGGYLYFGGRDSTTGDFELWQSNGTTAGTNVLKEIRPGDGGSFPRDFAQLGSTVLFTASAGTGRAIWKTDGTAAGTVEVKDFDADSRFFAFGAWAYFECDDNTGSGRELCRTDGTTGNTGMFTNINPAGSSFPRDFAVVGSNLLFSADDGTNGREIWKTDGSTTSQVKDINTSGSSNPEWFFATGIGNEAYFAAEDAGGRGAGLWHTDGTMAGTVEVAELSGESAGGPQYFGKAGATIVFTASVGISGSELWAFQDADCGDADDPSYPTLLVNGGACHRAIGVTLGSSRDVDSNGQPTANADGDDLDGSNDDDGVVFTSGFNLANPATFDVTLSAAGYLNVWIDWDANGDWDDFADLAIFKQFLGAGTHSLSVAVPGSATTGTTYARFRVDSTGAPFPRGILFDGEVEDYQITIGEILDFGDAPDPLVATAGEYPTLLVNDGARHRVVAGVYMGSGVDADSDGQPNANASGDDGDGNDDEDGVTFTTALVPGSTGMVDVIVSTEGYIYAWLDFDQNGVWNDSEEIIIDGEWADSAGTHSFSFPVPAGAALGNTFARFRFDTNGDAYYPTGHVEDGEVEDYLVTVATASPPTADAGLDRSIAPNNQSIALGGMPAATNGTAPYSYSWSISPGVAGVDYSLTSSTAENPVFTGITEQIYTATLTVTDNTPLQDVDSASITVEVPDDRDLFNEDLTGTDTYEGCARLTAELVVIKDGADITFLAPIVELLNGFIVETGAMFTAANVTPSSCP